MIEFSVISVIVGILIGIVIGVVFGVFRTYGAAYESNNVGADTEDMNLKYKNAKRMILSEAEIKSSFEKSKFELEKKQQRRTIGLLMWNCFFPFISMAAVVVVVVFLNRVQSKVISAGQNSNIEMTEAEEVLEENGEGILVEEAEEEAITFVKPPMFMDEVISAEISGVEYYHNDPVLIMEITNNTNATILCEGNTVSIDNHCYRIDTSWDDNGKEKYDLILKPEKTELFKIKVSYLDMYCMGDSFTEPVTVSLELSRVENYDINDAEFIEFCNATFDMNYELREPILSEKLIFDDMSYENHNFVFYTEDDGVFVYKLEEPYYNEVIKDYTYSFYVENKREKDISAGIGVRDGHGQVNGVVILEGQGALIKVYIYEEDNTKVSDDTDNTLFQLRCYNQ